VLFFLAMKMNFKTKYSYLWLNMGIIISHKWFFVIVMAVYVVYI